MVKWIALGSLEMAGRLELRLGTKDGDKGVAGSRRVRGGVSVETGGEDSLLGVGVSGIHSRPTQEEVSG